MTNLDDLKAAAYHEAGHALLHAIFGERIDGLTVNADGTGKVSRFQALPIWDSCPGLLPDSQTMMGRCQSAMISMAGAVAEDAFIGIGMPEILYESSAADDWEGIQKLNLPESLLFELQDLTCMAVGDNWSKVQALAEDLFIQRTMSPDEADKYLDGVNAFSAYFEKIQDLVKAVAV